jgi:hypothetical protein
MILMEAKFIWGTLTHSRAIAVLKNPSYAGAYVHGRYNIKKNYPGQANFR